MLVTIFFLASCRQFLIYSYCKCHCYGHGEKMSIFLCVVWVVTNVFLASVNIFQSKIFFGHLYVFIRIKALNNLVSKKVSVCPSACIFVPLSLSVWSFSSSLSARVYAWNHTLSVSVRSCISCPLLVRQTIHWQFIYISAPVLFFSNFCISLFLLYFQFIFNFPLFILLPAVSKYVKMYVFHKIIYIFVCLNDLHYIFI